MKSLELLLVTRRFWPHSGLTELALSNLVRQIKQAGHQITVATVRWSRNWSRNVIYHDIPVVRFTRPVSGPWSSFRYSRALARHFAINTYDGIIASGLGDESLAVTRIARHLSPVLIRVDDGFEGVAGRLHRKHVELCQSAEAVVANSNPVAEQLARLEQMPEVAVVRDGIPVGESPYQPKADGQAAIRAALTEAHPVLMIDKDQPLVVCCSRMKTDSGLTRLVQAWPMVLRRYPGARLWLIGEGFEAARIWQLIVRLDVAQSVVMPGYFDQLDDIMRAADLYVHPGGATDTGEGMLHAMSHGLPAIAADNPWTSTFIESGVNGFLVRSAQPTVLAQEINQALSNIQRLAPIGLRARTTIAREFSSRAQVDRYVSLLSTPSRQLAAVAK